MKIRSNSYAMHVKNLQQLMTEIYKSVNNMNLSIELEFHEKKCVNYDRRKKSLCNLPKSKTTSYGVTLNDSIKQKPTLAGFKNKIKNWAGDQCTCRICQ